jgi:hypothetical protein
VLKHCIFICFEDFCGHLCEPRVGDYFLTGLLPAKSSPTTSIRYHLGIRMNVRRSAQRWADSAQLQRQSHRAGPGLACHSRIHMQHVHAKLFALSSHLHGFTGSQHWHRYFERSQHWQRYLPRYVPVTRIPIIDLDARICGHVRRCCLVCLALACPSKRAFVCHLCLDCLDRGHGRVVSGLLAPRCERRLQKYYQRGKKARVGAGMVQRLAIPLPASNATCTVRLRVLGLLRQHSAPKHRRHNQ